MHIRLPVYKFALDRWPIGPPTFAYGMFYQPFLVYLQLNREG
jgi:hypothetical protein